MIPLCGGRVKLGSPDHLLEIIAKTSDRFSSDPVAPPLLLPTSQALPKSFELWARLYDLRRIQGLGFRVEDLGLRMQCHTFSSLDPENINMSTPD